MAVEVTEIANTAPANAPADLVAWVAGVAELNATARPDVAVPEMAKGVGLMARFAGALKLIV